MIWRHATTTVHFEKCTRLFVGRDVFTIFFVSISPFLSTVLKIKLFKTPFTDNFPIKLNIKIAVLRWEKTNKLECNNEKRPKPQKQKQFLFLTFRLFPKHPIIYQFQSLFPLLPLTWHYSHHFTLQDEWKSEVPFFCLKYFSTFFGSVC